MPTTPPTIGAAPTAPQRGDKATFSGRVDAFVTWLVAAVSQFSAVAANVNANAAEAYASATTASTAATTATDARDAAIATANATLWVSGQSVAQYANKISPLDYQTYIRKTATGSGTTDPSLDPTNYVARLPLSKGFVSADQSVTSSGTLTIAHGMGVAPKLVQVFRREVSTGQVFCVNAGAQTANSNGLEVRVDSTNLYVAFGVSNPVFRTFPMNNDLPNTDQRIFVRAFA